MVKWLCFASVVGSLTPNAFCGTYVTGLAELTQSYFGYSDPTVEANAFCVTYVKSATEVAQVCFGTANADLRQNERRWKEPADLIDGPCPRSEIDIGSADSKRHRADSPDHFFFRLTRAVGITVEWPSAPWGFGRMAKGGAANGTDFIW